MNLGWKVINVNRGKGLTGAKDKCKNFVNAKFCRICGKPIHGGGNMCGSCAKFIRERKEEERQGK